MDATPRIVRIETLPLGARVRLVSGAEGTLEELNYTRARVRLVRTEGREVTLVDRRTGEERTFIAFGAGYKDVAPGAEVEPLDG